MAEACGVRTSVTRILNSSIMASVISPPFSLASDFCREPRWSMAAAAMTPRSFETFLRPASLPGVSFMRFLLSRGGKDEYWETHHCKPRAGWTAVTGCSARLEHGVGTNADETGTNNNNNKTRLG